MGECAYAFVKDDKRLLCTRHGRTAIAQSGVPADFYEICDFADTAGRYRCVFFFVTARTPALEDAEAYCRENRIPFLEFDGDTPVTPSEVRDFCVAAGVHCYCPDLDCGVWCGHNLAAVMALNKGMHTLRLPENRIESRSATAFRADTSGRTRFPCLWFRESESAHGCPHN